MNPPSESRYEAVSRRSFLRRAALAGAVVFAPGLASCGSSDGDAFAATTTTATSVATTTPGPSTTAVTTTLPDASSTTAQPASTTAAPDGTFPMGSEMVVRFTYTAADAGSRVRNPYIAVWVEDAAGELTDTIALWFLQSQKGTRWLSDLRRWYSVDGSTDTIQTVSSATRAPGDYAVAWPGTDLDGTLVPLGDYFICIEAAREHGPYSLIREPLVLDGSPMSVELPDQGELSGATIELAVG